VAKVNNATGVNHVAHTEPDEDIVAIDVDRIHRRCRLAWLNRKLLLVAILVGLAVGALLAFGLPAKYEARAVLMPPDFSTMPSVGMLMSMKSAPTGAMSGALSDLLGMKTAGGLIARALQTTVVEDRLINRFDLRNAYGIKTTQKARKKLESRTDVDEDRKSGAVTVTVLDKDPKRAAQIANAYVEELDKLMREVNTSASRTERTFIQNQLAAAKVDLDQSANELAQFSSKNTTLDLPVQGKAMVEAIAHLQGQVIAAEAQLRGLQQIYSDRSVRVQTAKAQIGELRHQLEALHGKEGATAVDSEGGDDDTYPSVRQLPLLSVTYMQLYRRAKVREVVYEVLTQQYELARLQDGRDVPRVQMLDPAVIPEIVSFPPRALLLVALPIIFFGLGLAYVWSNDWWQRTPAEDARRRLLEPAVAALSSRIPLMRVTLIPVNGNRWAEQIEPEEHEARR
jgi:capsule polysaccharide export protein KpsE/RkpR